MERQYTDIPPPPIPGLLDQQLPGRPGGGTTVAAREPPPGLTVAAWWRHHGHGGSGDLKIGRGTRRRHGSRGVLGAGVPLGRLARTACLAHPRGSNSATAYCSAGAAAAKHSGTSDQQTFSLVRPTGHASVAIPWSRPPSCTQRLLPSRCRLPCYPIPGAAAMAR